MVAMLWMPRLPTPIATRDPGFSRDANSLAPSRLCTSAGPSGMWRSGNFWRMTRRRGNRMMGLFYRVWGKQKSGAGSLDSLSLVLLPVTPLMLQQPRVLGRREQIEAADTRAVD